MVSAMDDNNDVDGQVWTSYRILAQIGVVEVVSGS
jgi:hypothetical protein